MKSSFRDSADNGADRRRTVIIERQNGSFGFTLQSYGIHYRQEVDVLVMTYVDFVDPNGHAQKAGLRSGDVIVSINGQDVEKLDHAALVNLIQSAPDRVRMVVVFENCVRKVELHMKYIRLQQLLEAKAREYQEICASEKSLISRLNKTRGIAGPGSYHTIQSSQVVLRRQQREAANTPATPGPAPTTYSSKSMPRYYVQQKSLDPSSATGGSTTALLTSSSGGSVSHHDQEAINKRRSYLCIGKPPPDCSSCFRQDDNQSSSPDSRNNTPRRQQRPRSFHIPSCYNPSDSPAGDERYLIQPMSSKAHHHPHQLTDHHHPKVSVYGGYGFGYDCSSNSYTTLPAHRDTSGHKSPLRVSAGSKASGDHHAKAAQRRSLHIPATNKSTEDLLSSQQFQSQCQIKPQKSLESITFYTRPSQPGSNRMEHHYHQPTMLQQQPRHHQHQPPLRHWNPPAVVSNAASSNDEGGFDQMRPYRTLPAARQ